MGLRNSMVKKKIINVLHVVPSYYPATKWGGPIFSTKAICDGITESCDVNVKVFTTDASGPNRHDSLDLPDSRTIDFDGYKVRYFNRIYMSSISISMLMALPCSIKQSDIVHLTGTYSFPTLPVLFFARIYDRPVVWSPRGAIQASFEWNGASKQSLKRCFELIARFVASHRTVLHVTAQAEALTTLVRMPGLKNVVIPNSVDIPPREYVEKHEWRKDNIMRLLFLGRIHEKKGIEVLLDAVCSLPINVELDIFGDGEVTYISALKKHADDLQLSDRVRFRGHVSGEDKKAAFVQADLFILPSYSENFGIAVAEALSYGVPVVTTTNTPWHELDSIGCGRCIDLGVSEIGQVIIELMGHDLAAMGKLGRKWMIREFSKDGMSKKIIKLYRSMLSEGGVSI